MSKETHKLVFQKKKIAEEGVNFDRLLRDAEHKIQYGAKRAIEMYIPVWKAEAALYLFKKCAEHYGLCDYEIKECHNLMLEAGMATQDEIDEENNDRASLPKTYFIKGSVSNEEHSY